MKFIKLSLASICTFMIVGCSTNSMVLHDEIYSLNQPERVLKHDFSKSKFSSVILTEREDKI